MKVQPPPRFSVWLSNHVRLVWAAVAANLFVPVVVVMFLVDLWDFWYIVWPVMLGTYLYFMRGIMRGLREVKSDAEYVAAREDSK